MTAYQLLDRLGAVRHRPAPPTIYRASGFLLERNMIQRVKRLAAYLPRIVSGDRCPIQFLICQER